MLLCGMALIASLRPGNQAPLWVSALVAGIWRCCCRWWDTGRAP